MEDMRKYKVYVNINIIPIEKKEVDRAPPCEAMFDNESVSLSNT